MERDCRTRLVRPNSQGRIGNLTWLTHPLAKCVTTHNYVRQHRNVTFRSTVGEVRAGKQGGMTDTKSGDVTTTSVPSFEFPCPAFVVDSAPVKSFKCPATNARSIAAELCPLVSSTYYRT